MMVKGNTNTTKEKLGVSIKSGRDRLRTIESLKVALREKVVQLEAEEKVILEQIQIYERDMKEVPPPKEAPKDEAPKVEEKKKTDKVKGW
jgi:hypothetical protein